MTLGHTQSASRGKTIIGLFDSGVGGLGVWHEVVRLLPHHPTLYLADSLHCPYGARPAEEIRRFSLGIARFLIECGAGMVVVACNTASAAGLESLRAMLDVPVVGMEPAVKPAAQQTRTGHVGVLATAGTLNGNLFRNTTARYANGVAVHVQVGEGLVERVEAGQVNTPETVSLLRTYLQPMLDVGVDQIVLGCTHYSFLTPAIRRIVPEWVSVVDPAGAVARRVEQVLGIEGMGVLETSADDGHPVDTPRFFTSGQPEVLAAMVGALTGLEPQLERVTWDSTEIRVVRDGRTGAYPYGTIP